MVLLSTVRLGHPWGADLEPLRIVYCLQVTNVGAEAADLTLSLVFDGPDPELTMHASRGRIAVSRPRSAKGIVTTTGRFVLDPGRSTMLVAESSAHDELTGAAWLDLERPPGSLYRAADLLLHATQRFVRPTIRTNGTDHNGMVVVHQQTPGTVSSETVPLATGTPCVTLESSPLRGRLPQDGGVVAKVGTRGYRFAEQARRLKPTSDVRWWTVGRH